MSFWSEKYDSNGKFKGYAKFSVKNKTAFNVDSNWTAKNGDIFHVEAKSKKGGLPEVINYFKNYDDAKEFALIMAKKAGKYVTLKQKMKMDE